MVVIRLQRRGTKKKPHHRIVVAERARAQSGRVLETLGHYDPSFDPPRLAIDESRFMRWIASGAQASEAVVNLMKRFKKAASAAAKP
jgi:small subunit ribosomal protein S16